MGWVSNLLVGVVVDGEVEMEAVAGLLPDELVRVRGRLEEFAGEMFESIVRKDQRRWGGVYLRG
jgi:hypothetical protein